MVLYAAMVAASNAVLAAATAAAAAVLAAAVAAAAVLAAVTARATTARLYLVGITHANNFVHASERRCYASHIMKFLGEETLVINRSSSERRVCTTMLSCMGIKELAALC